ncbi:MAG: recombinase family protein [Oscillospiraceae bacterium]|nr:recombinase family protein [Oscillospiraceae bacterium]
MKVTAIYTRQSADRKDSISIEGQVQACCRRIEVTQSECMIFTDKGFSGKNTDRPELKRMLSFIREGLIKRVVVYRLDRISRSMLDFLKMQQEFEKKDVEFISCGEDFDTSTPMGKMLLKVLMMFAEMERETIQKRVKDNYYSRGEKGMYLGGYAPFGYNKEDVFIGDKKTCCFAENKSESKTVKHLYNQFAKGNKNVSELVRELNTNACKTRRGGCWSATTVTRLLLNPVYVKANNDIYIFLKSKGAIINNSSADFNGKNGCYTYGNAETRGGTKFKSFEGVFVTIAPHDGIIQPDIWLKTRERLASTNNNNKSVGAGSLSWLQGLVKCGCGYSRYVKHIKNEYSDIRYFYCHGRKQKTCSISPAMLRADVLEEQADEIIRSRLNEKSYPNNSSAVERCIAARDKARKQIENLVNQIAESNNRYQPQGGAVDYIKRAIDDLDRKIAELDYELVCLESEEKQLCSLKEWDAFDILQKKQIARFLIKEIKVDTTTDIVMR